MASEKEDFVDHFNKSSDMEDDNMSIQKVDHRDVSLFVYFSSSFLLFIVGLLSQGV